MAGRDSSVHRGRWGSEKGSQVNLDDMSFVAASGNVVSMLLVGPMLVLVMRRLGWPHRRMLVVGLIGWTALFTAQMVMWREFGYAAGYPGFKYVQPAALPISFGNFLASMWLSKKPSQKGRTRVTSARH